MRTLGRGMVWLLGAAAACGGSSSGPNNSPSQVIASAGDNQIAAAGTQLSTALEVTVKDASGNPVANVTVNWAAASGGGSVTPASNTTGVDGKATATRTLGPNAGAQTTTATVSGVSPATFHHIAQIQGATQIAANSAVARSDSVLSTATFSAVVRDQNSLPVAGVIVTWSLTGTGALSQLVDTTDVSGLTSITLTLTQSATQRSVLATVTGLVGSPVTFVENAVAGNAAQMALNGGNFQAGAVSSPLPAPLEVNVRDAYGNGKSGVTVTWKLEGAAASPSTTTDAAGIAALSRTLGANPGAYHDTAFVSGLDSIAFSDTAVAVTQIDVGSGGNVFSPTPATVAAGTFVRFAWAGGVIHNVHWDSAPAALPPNSPDQSSGTFLVRLTDVGSYGYHCTFHGTPTAGMHGVINVN